jgi:hypothetical protein
MNSHQGFSMAWKPMSMCVIGISITQFLQSQSLRSQSSPTSGAYLHSSSSALLARLSLLLRRFRSNKAEATELPQPSTSSGLHPRVLFVRLFSLVHRSPPENDAATELQQPSTPSRLDPHALLVRLSSLWPRSRLDTDEETEPHPTTPSGSRPDALIDSLSSLFRSQSHTNEELQLSQYSRRPHVVEVAAVRDREVCLSSVSLQLSWFNDFCLGHIYCSTTTTKNTAADPIAHSGIIHDTICSRNQSYCTTSKTSVFTTRPIVGSSRAFSLLRISSTRHC